MSVSVRNCIRKRSLLRYLENLLYILGRPYLEIESITKFFGLDLPW